MCIMRAFRIAVLMGVTRRKLQTPGTADEHQEQETPTISPNNRQPAQLTDQAPDTFERAVQESGRVTPTSTAKTRHHYLTGSPPDPLSKRSPGLCCFLRVTLLRRHNTDICMAIL